MAILVNNNGKPVVNNGKLIKGEGAVAGHKLTLTAYEPGNTWTDYVSYSINSGEIIEISTNTELVIQNVNNIKFWAGPSYSSGGGSTMFDAATYSFNGSAATSFLRLDYVTLDLTQDSTLSIQVQAD